MREMKAGTNYHLPAKGGKYGVKPFVLNLLQEIRSKCKVYKDGCWVWQGRVNKSGNPIVKYKGKVYTVMNKLWSWAYDEPQPTRLYRTKHCYNERCVKRDHLTNKNPTRREQFLKELPND